MNIFDRVNRLDFFEKNIGVDTETWLTSNVLDYGGNRGNLIEDLKEKFPDTLFNYTCIDVDPDALEFGKSHSPECSWVLSESYNQAYNPTGKHDYTLPFDNDTFDYIFAYSVHSHTTLEQMVYDLTELVRVAKPKGKILTTVPENHLARFFLNKRLREFGSTVNADNFINIDDYLYFINHDTVTKEFELRPVQYFVSFYNVAWLRHYLKSLNFNVHSPQYTKKIKVGYEQTAIIIEK